MSSQRRRVGPLIALSASVLVACGGPARYHAVVSASPATGTGSCAAAAARGQLPGWARAGLAPGEAAPHVFGTRGEIVAILLGYPYSAPAQQDPVGGPPRTGRRRPAEPGAAHRGDPGRRQPLRHPRTGRRPGPSDIGLPAPGCRHPDLSWSGRTDAVDIPYEVGRPPPPPLPRR